MNESSSREFHKYAGKTIPVWVETINYAVPGFFRES